MKFLAWAPVTRPMGFGPRVPNCCIVLALSSGVIIQGSMVQILSKDLLFFSFIKITGKLVKEIFLSVPGRDKSIFKVVDKFKELKSNCQIIYIEMKKIVLDWFLGFKLDIFFHVKSLNYKWNIKLLEFFKFFDSKLDFNEDVYLSFKNFLLHYFVVEYF